MPGCCGAWPCPSSTNFMLSRISTTTNGVWSVFALPVLRWTIKHHDRLYLVACIALIAIAAALRLANLATPTLWLDEAVAANNAKGSFSELIANTRDRNSSPILYPLILFAVQKWQSTALSVRMVPALSSVLTVAALALLMPRVGVGRWTSFLAACMATISVEAIVHARDAREYSLDALIAVLLIAGLLTWLRYHRIGLLCFALSIAPLVQYNLVLFSAAILGTGLIHWGRVLGTGSQDSESPGMSKSKLLQDLAWLIACFVAGCAVTATVTLPYHWRPGGFASNSYLSAYYFQGDLDAFSTWIGFTGLRTKQLLEYHLPSVVPVVGGVALALMLMGKTWRREGDVLATLLLLSLSLAIAAALLGIYPLGPIRQCLYLGPVIFLVWGKSLVWILDETSPEALRSWLAPTGLAALLAGIAFTGFSELKHADVYVDKQPIKDILTLVEDQALADDHVFASGGAAAAVQFHRQRPLDYHFGKFEHSFDDCFQEVQHLWQLHQFPNLWLIGSHFPVCQGWHVLELIDEQVQVERLFNHPSSQLHVARNLYAEGETVIASRRSSTDPIQAIDDLLLSLEPLYAEGNQIYHFRSNLILVVGQCTSRDINSNIRVEVFPRNEDEQPFYGYLNMQEYSFFLDDRCLAVYPLPELDWERLQVVQYRPGQESMWEAAVSPATSSKRDS